MKYFLVIFALLLIIVLRVHIEGKSYTNDYCWRDYDGDVPLDAFKAGLDKYGHPIYFGQVLFQNKLIGGQIFTGSDYIYFDWLWKEYFSNVNVKILCTNQPQKFEWIITSCSRASNLIKSKIAVPGGYEEYETYIGRVFSGGEKAVGKILCNPDECLGLHTTQLGTSQIYKDFEVLTYNPTINSTGTCEGTSPTFPIDVRRTAK